MSCCDSLSEEINGLKIEISRLVNREFDLECEVERLKKLALEAYQTPMNTGKEKCRIIELLSEMIA